MFIKYIICFAIWFALYASTCVKGETYVYDKACGIMELNNTLSSVTIYQDRNFKGRHQCLTFQNEDECTNLNSSWHGVHRVSALKTHYTCVRLFLGRNCTGDSLDATPSYTMHVVNLKGVIKSISPCPGFNDSLRFCGLRETGNDCMWCEVDSRYLFSANSPLAQATEVTDKFLNILKIIGEITIKGLETGLPPGFNVMFGVAAESIRKMYDSGTLTETMVMAHIEQAIARNSASQIFAKIHSITSGMESVLSNSTQSNEDDANIQIAELVVAWRACGELKKLFEDDNYSFSQNKLVSSPYLVSFSALYLNVAKMVKATRPKLAKKVDKNVRELYALNLRFRDKAIDQRKEFVKTAKKLGRIMLEKLGIYLDIGFYLADLLPNYDYRRFMNMEGHSTEIEQCVVPYITTIYWKMFEFFWPTIYELEKFS